MPDNAFVRALLEAVDRIALNNQGFDYKSGQWNREGVKEGAIQRGAGLLGTFAGGPLGGMAATKGTERFMNRPSKNQQPMKPTPPSQLPFTPPSVGILP